MELTAKIVRSVDDSWLALDTVHVGPAAATSSPPLFFVNVSRAGKPFFRVDVRPYGDECFAFEEIVVWAGHLFIGVGNHLHVVAADGGAVQTFDLGNYFGHLYPTSEYLLVASGVRLFCFRQDGTLCWRSHVLGIDGVVVTEATPERIEGEGEWDPPGGWRRFELLSATGSALQVITDAD